MKKINTFFLLFLVSTLSIFAQEDEKTNQKLLTEAPYIFKGSVKSYKAFRKGFVLEFKTYLPCILE